jgi:hypothetical protein
MKRIVLSLALSLLTVSHTSCGPALAAAGYWGTKALCYLGLSVGIGSALVATGGVVGGVGGVACGAANAAIVNATGGSALLAVGTGAIAQGGAVTVAGVATTGTIVSASVTASAATTAIASTGAVAVVGPAAVVVAGIESASLTVMSVLLWIPVL